MQRILRDECYDFIVTDARKRVHFLRNAGKEELDFDRLEEADRIALNLEPGQGAAGDDCRGCTSA